MKQSAAWILFAHGGGGKLDPFIATVLGIGFLGLGGFVFVKSILNVFNKKSLDWGLLYFSFFISLFGYSFLATGQGFPGGNLSIQIFLWMIALPLLFIPYFLWKINRFQNHQLDSRTPNQEGQVHSLNLESQLRSFLKPGETLLWTDKPSLRHFRGEMWAYFFLGLIAFSFGSVFLSFVGWSLAKTGMKISDLPGLLIGTFSALFFSGLGVLMIQSPWRAPGRLNQVIYGLTDRRALVLTSNQLFWNPVPNRDLNGGVMDFPCESIKGRKRKKVGFSRIDWIFQEKVPKSGKNRSVQRYGFLGLEHPEIVGDLMDRNYPH